MSDNDVLDIQIEPWSEDRQKKSYQQVIDWVSKNYNKNPTVSKESMLQTIQVYCDLPNDHPTMEAIYDLPEGKTFAGYPAVVEFFEGLGYKGFKDPDLLPELDPDQATPLTPEENLENELYWDETIGPDPMLSEAATSDASESDPVSGGAGPDDPFSESELEKFAELAKRMENGEDVSDELAGSDKEPSELGSSNDIDEAGGGGPSPVTDENSNTPNSDNGSIYADIPSAEDESSDKKEEQSEDGDNPDNAESDKEKEAKEKAAKAARAMDQAQAQAQAQQGPQDFSSALAWALARMVTVPFGVVSNIMASKRASANGPDPWVSGDIQHDERARPVDETLGLHAEVKAGQIRKLRDDLDIGLNSLRSGLNARGEPASESEKNVMRDKVEMGFRDLHNRIAEAKDHLEHPELGDDKRGILEDSLKSSNDIMKSLNDDDSEEGKKLKDKLGDLLKSIGELLKSIFTRNKGSESNPPSM